MIRAHAAIVHDWFQGFHGSERVVDHLLREVLAAAATVDVHTFHAARELLPDRLAARDRPASRGSRGLPGVRQVGARSGQLALPAALHAALLPLPAAWTPMTCVIASSHSCAVNARAAAGVPYLCYCYTPMRYAWLPGTEARAADRAQRSGAAGLPLAGCAPPTAGPPSPRAATSRISESGPGADRSAYTGARRGRPSAGRAGRSFNRPPADETHPSSGSTGSSPSKRPALVAEAFRGLPTA